MRLIDTKTLALVSVNEDDTPPPQYAILSHTWGSEQDEVSFQEMKSIAGRSKFSIGQGGNSGAVMGKSGFAKIKQAAAIARSQGLPYVWVDTCCIDKTSSSELSEAINSMYRWYSAAKICYAYLSDVAVDSDERPPYLSAYATVSIKGSRWFTRGWTLQELVAPRRVVFYSKDWTFLGQKGDTTMKELLSVITGIDNYVLGGTTHVEDVSVARRMNWAASRNTTRPEDLAYCLMGLFNVNMPLLYGEGNRAFIRLQEEIIKETDDQSIFFWKFPRLDKFGTLRGLLAPSPQCFQNSTWARPLPSLAEGEPPTMTSRGLRIRLNIRYIPSLGSIAILDCYPVRREMLLDIDDPKSASENGYELDDDINYKKSDEVGFAILLRKLGNGQYARVKSSKVALVPPLSQQRQVVYETVYVKQTPKYSPPDTLVQIPEPRTLFGYTVELTEIHPPSRWTWESKSLRSDPKQVGRVMGVFRFLVKGPASKGWIGTIDVLLGLQLQHDGEWTCRVTQQGSLRGGDPGTVNDIFITADHSAQENPSQDLTFFTGGVQVDFNIQACASIGLAHGRKFAILRLEHPSELDSSSVNHAHTLTGLHSLRLQHPPRSWSHQLAKMTNKITIEDSLDLSVFPGPGRHAWNAVSSSRIRVKPPPGMPNPMETLKILLSGMGFEHLRVLEPDGGKFIDNADHENNIKSLVLSSRLSEHGYIRDGTLQRSRLECVVVCDTSGISHKEANALPSHRIALRPVFWAALQGQASFVRRLVTEMDVDTDLRASHDFSFYHAIVLGGAWSLFDLFKAETPKTTWHTLRTENYGDTATHFAAAYAGENVSKLTYYSSSSIVDHLLCGDPTTKSPPTLTNCAGETPLHRAAAMGNIPVLEYLLTPARQPWLVEVPDHDGRTPLWHAAAAGETAALELLLGRGRAAVDAADALGRTPLHAACHEGHAAAARLLLERGANARARTGPPGFTAAQLAALFGHAECLRHLHDFAAAFSPTATVPSSAGSSWLVSPEEAFAAATDALDVPPLHLAAANGWVGCVRRLLLCGCEVEVGSRVLVLVDPEGEFGRVSVLEKATGSVLETARVCGQRGVEEFLLARMRGEEDPTPVTPPQVFELPGY